MKNLFVEEKYETFKKIAQKIFKENFFKSLIVPELGRNSLRDIFALFCGDQFTHLCSDSIPKETSNPDYIPSFSKTFSIRHNFNSTYLLQWQAPGGSGKTHLTVIFSIILFFSEYHLKTLFSVSENAIVEEIEQRLTKQIVPHLRAEYRSKITFGSLKGWEKSYRDNFQGDSCQCTEILTDTSHLIYQLKYDHCPTCPIALRYKCPLIKKIIKATQSDILITNHHVLLKTKQVFTGIGEKRLCQGSTTKELLLDRFLVIDESERFTDLCFQEGYLDISRSKVSLLEDKYSHPNGTNEWLEKNEFKWKERLTPDALDRIRKDDISLANTLEKLRNNQERGDLYNRTSEFLRHLKTFVRRMDDFAELCSIDQHSWQVNLFQDYDEIDEMKEKLINLFVEAYFINQNPFIKHRLILYAFDHDIKLAVELVKEMGDYTNFVLRDFIRVIEKFHNQELDNFEQTNFDKIESFFLDQDSLRESEWRKYLKDGKKNIKKLFNDYKKIREFWLSKIRMVSRYNPNNNAQYNHYEAGLFFPSRMYRAFRRSFLNSPYICLMSATGLSISPQNEYMNRTIKRVLTYAAGNQENSQKIYHGFRNDVQSSGTIHLVEVMPSDDKDNGLGAPSECRFEERSKFPKDVEKRWVEAKIREILLIEGVLPTENILPHYKISVNADNVDLNGSSGIFVGSNMYMTWIKNYFDSPIFRNLVVTRSEVALLLLTNPKANLSDLFSEKRIFIADSQDETFLMEIGFTDTQKISDYALSFHQLFCQVAEEISCIYIGLWQGNYRGVNLVSKDQKRSILKRQHWLFYSTVEELSRSLLYDHFRPTKNISPHNPMLQIIFNEFTLIDFLREKDQLICRSHRYPGESSFIFLHDLRELNSFEKSAKGKWSIEEYINNHKDSFSDRFRKCYIEPILQKKIKHACQLEIKRKNIKFTNDLVARCQQIVQSDENLDLFHEKIYSINKPHREMLRTLFITLIKYAECFSNEELGYRISNKKGNRVGVKEEFKKHQKNILKRWQKIVVTEDVIKCCKIRILNGNGLLFMGEAAWNKHFH